ncbi:hypothetical protein L2E82_14655 [Cichorium intybus]|uniref:Uncharacterized protein n=1 Tax=Cichorium intybus TaxID=13427 RepID=A0ACB9F0L9_CICIN|nr:hypothetical protein L2E82_14655 [Cichorium intybus]
MFLRRLKPTAARKITSTVSLHRHSSSLLPSDDLNPILPSDAHTTTKGDGLGEMWERQDDLVVKKELSMCFFKA